MDKEKLIKEFLKLTQKFEKKHNIKIVDGGWCEGWGYLTDEIEWFDFEEVKEEKIKVKEEVKISTKEIIDEDNLLNQLTSQHTLIIIKLDEINAYLKKNDLNDIEIERFKFNKSFLEKELNRIELMIVNIYESKKNIQRVHMKNSSFLKELEELN